MQANATLHRIGMVAMLAAVGGFIEISGVVRGIVFVIGALLYVIF